MKPAVFLDRDGVLIQDVDWLTRAEQLQILPGVPAALRSLTKAGFALVVVSNQPVVARGWISEGEVEGIHYELERRLVTAGSPLLTRFYFCPHHPSATLPAYRVDCDCRKPRPGLLLRAARELELDLDASFMVGDRITDIAAGAKAGCRTVLVQTGKHLDRPIESREPLEANLKPDHVCADLPAAVKWIRKQGRVKNEE